MNVKIFSSAFISITLLQFATACGDKGSKKSAEISPAPKIEIKDNSIVTQEKKKLTVSDYMSFMGFSPGATQAEVEKKLGVPAKNSPITNTGLTLAIFDWPLFFATTFENDSKRIWGFNNISKRNFEFLKSKGIDTADSRLQILNLTRLEIMKLLGNPSRQSELAGSYFLNYKLSIEAQNLELDFQGDVES